MDSLLDRLLHAGQHVVDALAKPDDNDASGRVAHPIVVHHAATDVRADLDETNVAHENRGSVGLRSDRHLLDVGRLLKIASPAHHVLGAGELQYPAAHFLIAAADLLDHFVDRDLVGQQLVGIDGDLVLLDEAAYVGDFRNARNCAYLILDLPLLERAKVGQRVFPALVDQNVFQPPTHAGCVRPELG